MPRRDREAWAADTAISRPEALKVPVLVDFEGFGFTMNGMAHNISEGELENLIIPTFAPEGYQGFDEAIDFEEEARAEARERYQRSNGDN